MKPLPLAAVLAAISVLLPACTGEDAPARKGVKILSKGSGLRHELRLRFTPGRSRKIFISRNLEQAFRNTCESVRQETYITIETAKEGEKRRRLKLTFDRMVLVDTMDGVKKMSLDTASAEKPRTEAAVVLSAIAGKSLSVVVNENAEIVEVSSFDEFIDGIAAKVTEYAGRLSPEALENLKKDLAENFTFRELAGEVTENLEMLPGASLAVGAKWEQPCSVTFRETGKMNLTAKCEFAAVEGDIAVLKRTFRLEKPLAVTHPIPMTVDLLEGSAVIRFDLERGELVSVTGETDLKLTSKVRAKEESISRKMTRVTKYETKKQ